ncbi:hypothetical protein LTS15_010689 [Exophiala xenobiotica]|nr:hypothetical protein LTS15_010689 [Exophiala xenobiotica]
MPGAGAGEGKSQTSERWAVHVPVIAFEHDTLLYAILAVSSAHLSTLLPDANTTTQYYYHIAAKYYFGIVLHALNQAHQGTSGSGTGMDRLKLKLNADNADALCLTCMIVSVLAHHFQNISDRPTATTTTAATTNSRDTSAAHQIPLKGMCISHRSGALIKAAWHWIRQSPSSEAAKILKNTPIYQEVVNHRTAEWHTHTSSHRQGQVVYPIDHSVHPAAVQQLQKKINEEHHENEHEHIENEQQTKSIRAAIGYIGKLSRAIEAGEESDSKLCVRVIGFTGTVPKAFLQMALTNNPRALLVLAYFFALASRLKNVWWLGDMAERGLRRTLAALPKDWKPLMCRPFDMAGISWEQSRRGDPISSLSVA